MRWSRNRNSCLNCQSEERSHVGRGLCTICYRLTLKKTTAEGWRLGHSSTLKGYPFQREPGLDPRSFDAFKRKVIRHYQDRLDYLKHRGEMLKGDVDGLDLEYGFAHLARLAGSKNRSLFHGFCGWFEMTFGPDQRRALLSVIDTIERDVDRDINLASLLLARDY